MVRLILSAITVAVAAGRCMAEPMGEPEIQAYGAMGEDNQQEQVNTYVNTMDDAPTTPTKKPGTEEILAQLPKLVEKQLQLQEDLMNKIIKDVDDYMKEASKAFTFENAQSSAVTKVNDMMEKISTRMATAIQGANELMANSEALDTETLRSATMKFMKEVRVQDIVVDALWASLRGTQTNAFLTGTAGIEKDACTASKRAEELLSRMYHNLRAAGISEEDIVKFVPKPGMGGIGGTGGMGGAGGMGGMQMRNMGTWGRGYGGYAYGYGYPYYSYGYSYPSYAYSYPSYAYSYPYYSYGSLYSYSYPYYSYGYGYPYAFGFRRLRPNTCPGCPPVPPVPVTGMPEEPVPGVPEVPMGVPPQKPVVPPFRSMGEETMGMGSPSPMGMGYTDPMMGYGMGSEYGAPLEQNMGYPMGTMTGMNGIESLYNTYSGMSAGYRNLAPMEFPGLFPESGMPTPFGFGPIGGLPL